MKKGVGIGLIAGLVVAMGCGVVFYDAFPGTLRFTDEGPRGTGVATYVYPGRALKLRERYVRGQIQKSEWFRPDGTLIQTTNWVDGAGEGIYLRDDGSIKTRMNYIKGLAEGTATYYAPDGTVTGSAEFQNGSRVSGYDPHADPERK
jgi:antitoxin component YwqK of YwqJK toxin-antitoxin module